jgi:hypothetical protein
MFPRPRKSSPAPELSAPADPTDATGRRRQLLLEWRAAAKRVGRAYTAWSAADQCDRDRSYASLLDALTREERADDQLERLMSALSAADRIVRGHRSQSETGMAAMRWSISSIPRDLRDPRRAGADVPGVRDEIPIRTASQAARERRAVDVGQSVRTAHLRRARQADWEVTLPAQSSPGTWCRRSALRSSVTSLAAQAAWSSGTSSLISLSV